MGSDNRLELWIPLLVGTQRTAADVAAHWLQLSVDIHTQDYHVSCRKTLQQLAELIPLVAALFRNWLTPMTLPDMLIACDYVQGFGRRVTSYMQQSAPDPRMKGQLIT